MARVTTSEILMQLMQLQSKVGDMERSLDRRITHIETIRTIRIRRKVQE